MGSVRFHDYNASAYALGLMLEHGASDNHPDVIALREEMKATWEKLTDAERAEISKFAEETALF